MKKVGNIHAPKVVLNFTIKQMTNFVSSKAFKTIVTDFLFNVVDDVVTLVYDNHHTSDH